MVIRLHNNIIMDNIDEQIIHLLEQDAQQSSKAIAKQIHLSSATVRRRLRRLIDSNVLDIVAIRDPARTGLSVAALVAFNIEHNLLDSVMKMLSEHSKVVWACTTTGRFDGFAFVRFSSNEELSLFLRNEIANTQGIKDSETFICLHSEKYKAPY